MNDKKVNLTSAEIASLWTGYMNDSMSKYVLSFMLKYTEEQEIKTVIQYAHDISSQHLEELRVLFEIEKYAVPDGFTDQDVNMNAPWLFSDIFCLTYVTEMARVGMLAYSGFVAMCARKDIRDYFTKGLTEVSTLYNLATDTALTKGLFTRHPYMEVPKETDYVDSKKYYSGLNPFSSKRPLNAVEITHLYSNQMTNTMGVKLCISFSQTSPSKEVQEFMLRGKAISQKHNKIFSDKLNEDDIQSPHSPDLGISNSTTKTFSDKLLMYHMSLLTAAGIGNYATAAAASQRTDLAIDYERLSLEVARLAKSGADIMIKNNWLEQPPGTKDREKLAKDSEKS